MQRPPEKFVGPDDLFPSTAADFDQRDEAPALLRKLAASPLRLPRAEAALRLLLELDPDGP